MKRNKKSLTHNFSIPVSIREISLSLFFFMIGRGIGGDTFFSVYVKSILGAGFGVTLIGILLALAKMLVVIPVGAMNDRGSTKYLLLLGKIIYAVCGCLYFLAGVEHSAMWLVFAVIVNAIASSMMFVSYRNLYGKKGNEKNRTQVFGVYFSSINLAYVIGAFLSAILVYYIDLPYMYLFIVIFSMLSILQDKRILDFIKKKTPKTWRKYEKKLDMFSSDEDFSDDIKNVKKFVGKKGVVPSFLKEVTSLKPRKIMFTKIKAYGSPMYTALASMALVSFMNYVGFLFVPIIALENNLTLPQIAIMFGVMKIPYIVNILFGSIGDKYSKKILIAVLIFISAIFYILFGCCTSFLAIVLLSFGSSLMVALLSPLTSALVTGYVKPKDTGMLSGLQECVGRCGEIIGTLGFGSFVALVGMDISFIILGIGLLVLSGYLLIKKFINRKNRDHEALKEKLAHIPLFSK